MACLAVVLNGPKAKNGRRVFESFVEQNKQSFWNRELVAASESLIYMGFMRPGTLFISGVPDQLNVLKDAWARRVLKPAKGYTITSLGDLGAIQQVEQMHFVPLGDVICDAVSQLNRNGHPATESTVRQHVARHCAHVAPPGIEMVRQTITSLLATGFIYKMGEHYFVSVPTNSPPKMKTTVECQTGTSILNPHSQIEKLDRSDKEKNQQRKGIFSRLFSRGIRPTTMPQPSQSNGSSMPISFAPAPMFTPMSPPPMPPAFPPRNKFPTYHNDLAKECPPVEKLNNEQYYGSTNQQPKQTVQLPLNVNQQKKVNRRKRREAKLMSSSSECLNYGPIDPPELLPGCVEMIDDMGITGTCRRQKRKQAMIVTKTRDTYSAERKIIPEYPSIGRTSTPIGSDSAYSPSPVTDSNDEMTSHSDQDYHEQEENHTYINLARFPSCNDSTQFEDLTCATDEPQILATQIKGVLISNL